ncbi:hypothetical protein E2C01_090943 [Portunus trituberculatus]|uniref:Uncharacterized protein n=1 Tax=Portunus trituberculatus TaxID=210409 RepID=A0A5B7JLN2_PORTR|nr:hypothetical protein [Portunus trituberculatus]
MYPADVHHPLVAAAAVQAGHLLKPDAAFHAVATTITIVRVPFIPVLAFHLLEPEITTPSLLLIISTTTLSFSR